MIISLINKENNQYHFDLSLLLPEITFRKKIACKVDYWNKLITKISFPTKYKSVKGFNSALIMFCILGFGFSLTLTLKNKKKEFYYDESS